MQIYFLLAAVAAAAAVAITEKAKKRKENFVSRNNCCLSLSPARLLSALPEKRNTKIRKLSCRRHLFRESLFAVGL
jgi:hypothetical protein